MGQGYSLTTLPAGSAGIDVPELADLSYEKSLGNARFMKSIRARTKNGLAVAKVVMKPYPSMKLDPYVTALVHEGKALSDVPNALGHHRIVETSTNGYLVRQYIHSSLYDRMSTRPFLEDIEKKWLSFQLLCAVRDSHARNVYHGDIKTENCLVTSWNWLYLTDFSSSFKPTYLPEDNPADFSFYFDMSGRRTCYLAPERFLSARDSAEGHDGVNWAMDIFSVGCVIAELFLESPIFSLSQLFKYRKGEYEPQHTHLSKIEDVDIRELASHMIQLNPEKRYSADEYLTFWRRKAFPDYFYGFLHQYMYLVTDPSSGNTALSNEEENMGEADERIDRIHYDFDKISYFLGYENEPDKAKRGSSSLQSSNDLYPLHIDIPNNQHQVVSKASRNSDDGTLIFLTLVVASMRSTARAQARIRACELLLAFSERLTDEAKLDRVLPYVMSLLNDKADLVKISAIRTLTQLLALVSVVSPINAYIFPEFILPRLQPFVPGSSSKPNALVRATYASSLAMLATTASRFLDMMQALRADGSLPSTDPEAEDGTISRSIYQTLFDVAREDLVLSFESQTKALLTDSDSSVRRAFLGSVSSLCVFFGSAKANDVILSHLNTYLNDRDWMLKCAFFETIVGVATYVGGASLEEFILPLMVQALTDPEDFVVERVLRSFAAMANLGLFQRSTTWELIDVVGRFTMHPNIWIRESAAHFICASTTYLSVADCHSIIIPLIAPYLKVFPSNFSEVKLLDCLKKPLPRLVFEMAMTWATKAEKGLFWKPAQRQRTFSVGEAEDATPTLSARDLGPKALTRIPKNEEDEQWISRLRNAGMGPDDEFKLLAMREYVWRVAQRRSKDPVDTSSSRFNSIVPMKDLGIAPQTIFFDNDPKFLDNTKNGAGTPTNEERRPHTIADALLDASTTVDDPISRRKRSHINTHLGKIGRTVSVDGRLGETQSNPPVSAIEVQGSGPPDGKAQRPADQTTGLRKRGADSSLERLSAESIDTKVDGHAHGLRHKGSAISLLNAGEGMNKASAETGTTSANAFGKIDAANARRTQPSPLSTALPLPAPKREKAKFQAAHSYQGNDPTVLRLLDNLYLENYPLDELDFGPLVTPITRRRPISRPGAPASMPWRPEGTLVAVLGEHKAAVTRIALAPDHSFFLTGSDDGTVKVWDSARLEKNVNHRARLTHRHSEGVKITALTFLEDTYCFASMGSDGSVCVVKVDYTPLPPPGSGSGAATTGRYGKLRVLRSHQLDVDEHAVWSEHFKSETQSILLLATNTCRLVAIDLRDMSLIYTLQNPNHHGVPTCFCVDRKRHWVLLGTAHGVMDLWDIRFRLRLKGWRFSAAAPIHRIMLQPLRSRRNRVIVAGGSGQADFTVWDLEKVACKEAYRIVGNPTVYGNPSSLSSSSPYRLLDIDEERAGSMLSRFATSLPSPFTAPSASPGPGAAGTSLAPNARSIRAVAGAVHVSDDSTEPRHAFYVSAGPDWKVRFWDLSHPDAGCTISGADIDEPKPIYSVNTTGETIVMTAREGGAVDVAPSTTPSRQQGRVRGGESPAMSPSPTGRAVSRAESNTSARRSGGGGGGSGGSTGGRASRSSIITLQQQNLLKSHMDAITDVAILEYPFGMVISADRSGVVYVFQ
ncbi:phosphoinositide 3-kinase regulatory subunit 4 [Lineolata rhizophorae]|uniref:non-specific serine/threonine protein kinase n=1 Tax=Lineolata rhizophorae TaxID=578093 RepID=A0A6A6P5H5_9PEZI|nr:phosphoinositide 3-kinase regulatory subunit 4 [Lineolata rhizophorae]